ncbi:type II toxin-antitoxin system ParD family antitoxin [Neorhizobium sp. CSC1952]|uniref:type II toxin-antitoxin system ParD family antitoxin n=1 Tax=Neorhizobium sp. CSC1952 TaxID=2978974 RepID=UPI0025A57555|nr:type II toxin-antitoxin system ParD family antitoxin [Rhizobium sp. CSC1952]WJR67490.1 type II toxin-antitoxin system ParD family antitoxin [Rhizobium sp. CSC1952]
MTEIHLSEEDRAFIEEQVKDGRYTDVSEAVMAGIRLLKRHNTSLQQLIQAGLDDVEAGRVHSYDTAEEFLADIERLSNERKLKTGTGH